MRRQPDDAGPNTGRARDLEARIAKTNALARGPVPPSRAEHSRRRRAAQLQRMWDELDARLAARDAGRDEP